MSEFRINGYAHMSMDVYRVEHLRRLVKYLDKYSVPDSAELDWDTEKVFITLAEGEGEFIECGDHIYPETKYDVLLNTHRHDG